MSKSFSGYEFDLKPVGNLEPVLPGKERRSKRGEMLSGGPLQIVYGNDRENTFSGSSSDREPVVFVGGDKGDTYKITPGLISIVADLAEEPESGDDDKPDTLDLTAIDRQNGLWGYIRVGVDYLMTDIVSGMVTLLHDPFGMQSAGNAIEQVRVQYRDPESQIVDPLRSEVMSLSDWINGGPGTLMPMVDFGQFLQAAPIPPGLINGGVVANYDAYNGIMFGFRQLGEPGLTLALQQLLDGTDYVGAAPLLANVIQSLPLTPEIGLPTDGDVQTAWFWAAHNVEALG
jgi:hypothetical protein